MRTLLVDNYDSFTYNLHHLLAEVSGTEPVVIRNDDPGWSPDRLREFDNVVLSPGPGSPEVPADFGICREILEHGGLPALGVCLGHQGAALLYGATVGRAPEPRHGRVSPVEHRGQGLFAGLPSPFDVVRYHSLAVTDLPDELEAVAWTPDGVLMGFQHRERPLWGVQFHPESILTRHGHGLLANFMRLTSERRNSSGRPAGRAPRPARDTALEALAAPAGRRGARALRVLAERTAAPLDQERAFERLFGGDEHTFWLDSSRPDEGAGRFSVMGAASGPLGRVARANTWDGTVTVESADGEDTVTGSFFDWIDEDLRSVETDIPPLPFDFALGWVGYLGYELKAECGGDKAHKSEDADAVMLFADRAVVLDHATGHAYLLALAEPSDERAARDWLASAAALAAEPDPGARRDAGPPGGLHGVALRHDHETYLRMIGTCQDEMAAGETYEVCLTNMIEARGDLDPLTGYRFLRRLSPAPYGALLSFGELSVLSTSPECFLRIGADRVAESRPIKGTRPRGTSARADAELVADLLANEKDRAENLMIVDLVRNDLGRCAEIGSVDASEIFQVETYATVHQLVSTVRARLRPGVSAVESARAAFPAGSMTGAPKIRTMRIIDRLEEGARGVYSGAIGYFSLSGAARLSVVIRTAVVTPGRVRYGVGGAVVALSDPEAEFEETAVKARPLLALAGAGFPGLPAGAARTTV
ncbi:aminodeoxychorismate synthase component I [Streptomyces sp. NPDC014894]|uniref:aminodeoxychorismate synthase component I n=1 Tax=Streptomyces sp. NPDC014894 TaxID=3364931 RepID=UPI0036FD2B64